MSVRLFSTEREATNDFSCRRADIFFCMTLREPFLFQEFDLAYAVHRHPLQHAMRILSLMTVYVSDGASRTGGWKRSRLTKVSRKRMRFLDNVRRFLSAIFLATLRSFLILFFAPSYLAWIRLMPLQIFRPINQQGTIPPTKLSPTQEDVLKMPLILSPPSPGLVLLYVTFSSKNRILLKNQLKRMVF